MADLGTADLELLIADVYPRLRAMAGHYMRGERANHTLQPTALANETLIRFLGSKAVFELPVPAFLRVASAQMRKVLIDHARRNRAKKRGSADAAEHPLALEQIAGGGWDNDSWIVLDEALDRLGGFDARALAVVELKFFGGHTTKETAAILEVSDGTVESDWQFARTWLFAALND